MTIDLECWYDHKLEQWKYRIYRGEGKEILEGDLFQWVKGDELVMHRTIVID